MRPAVALLLMISLLGCTGLGPAPQLAATGARLTLEQAPAGSYLNPLPVTLPDGTYAESCPDPSIIRGQTAGDTH